MSTSPFRKALRTFTTDALAQPGEHSRSELAQAFLAAHPELATAALNYLAERQVDLLIKELCDAEPDEQMALFDGLPAAIAVAPGLVKAIEHCTPEDLAVGEQHRKDNITAARERLQRYRKGVRAFLKVRVDEETVGQAALRLSQTAPKRASA